MRLLLIIFFSWQIITVHGQKGITVCSWNLKDFGSTKNNDEIDFIANVIKHFDIIAIQEVVAGNGGAQAVGRLSETLNRKGFKWDYTVSDPTISSSYKTERYAFIWKTPKLSVIGKAWLEKKYNKEIDREPFFATYKYLGKVFTLVNFHAITKSKQPETEIKYLKFLPAQYPDKNLIFVGDFNCPQTHTVFNPLKKIGYRPILTNQKTSLKKTCKNGSCLASEFDNIFFLPPKVHFMKSEVIHFYTAFSNHLDAWNISDHIPVVFQFSLN